MVANAVKHYEILHTGQVIAVKVNPKAYEVTLFRGRPPKDAILAFNTNYSWLGVPIGICRSNMRQIIPYLPTKMDVRPTITFDNVNNVRIVGPDALPTDAARIIDAAWVACQAGPLLLSYGNLCHTAGCYNGQFQPDAVRKTKHVAVGITPAFKIIAVWADNIGMQELAETMRELGCEFAMKVDGGHMAYFKFQEPANDEDSGVIIERGNTGKIVTGICFREKTP